jgi:hypothetical protein
MAAEDTSPAQDTTEYNPDLPHTGEDRAHAIPIETVSAAEAKQRQDSGGYTAEGKPSGPVMVDTKGEEPEPPAPKKRPAYWDTPMGDTSESAAKTPPAAPSASPSASPQPQVRPKYWDQDMTKDPDVLPPPPGPEPPPPNLWERTKAAVSGAYNSLSDAATAPGGTDDLVNSIPESAATKPFTSFMRQYLEDRQGANQQLQESGEMAFPDKDAIDPRNLGAFAAKATLALLNEGWSATGIPSAIHLLVSQPSKDLLTAGADAINKSGLVPPGEKSPAGFGISQGDVSRGADALSSVVDTVAQNAIPIGPHILREHYSPSSLQADIAKGQPVDAGKVTQGRVVEQPTTAMDHAVNAAIEGVKAAGGDALDQAVAATDVNAHVGAVHDAVSYEAHMQRAEELSLAQPEQPKGVVEPNAGGQALGADKLSLEPEAPAPEESGAPPPATLFERREQELAKQKDEDYTKALNQKGDQEVEASKTADTAAAKAGPEAPTLGDTLSDDEKAAFKSLAERRQAEMASEPPPPAPEDKVMPYTEPKGGEKNPIVGTEESTEAPKTLAGRRAQSPDGPLNGAQFTEADGTRVTIQHYTDRNSGREVINAVHDDGSVLSLTGRLKNPTAATVAEALGKGDGGEWHLTEPPKEAPTATAKPPQTLSARRLAGKTQAPELPPDNVEPPSGKVQAPDLRNVREEAPDETAPAPVDRIEEGDSWKAPTGAQVEVLKDHGDGTFTIRTTPTNSALKPIRRRVAQETLEMMRPYPEEEEAPSTRFSVRAKGIEGQEGVSQEAVNRHESDKAAGRTTHMIDPDGQVTDLNNPTDIDGPTPKGSVKYQKGVGIQDRGGLAPMQARGLVERARALHGFDTEPEPTKARDTSTRTRRQPVTKDAATKHLAPLIDRVGSDKIQIHDNGKADTVPQKVKDDMVKYNHPNALGAIEPDGTIHIFAEAHDNLSEVHDTVVHELAHKGIRSFLGDDYVNTMRDVYANIHDHESALSSPIDGVSKATGKSWMRDYLDQHGMDPRNPKHQAVAADEYAAHLAEHPGENPTILRRVIDAVRAGLRKVGVVREWTDADIRRLLRESHNNLISEHARAAKEYQGDTTRFADREDNRVAQLSATNPLADAHKFGKTMEDQANYNPGMIRSRLNFAKDWSGERLRDGLAFIHMRNLADFMRPDLMPSVRGFIRTHDAMTGRRGALMEGPSKQLTDWSKWASKNKEMGASLGDVMHSSTLAGVDPSKPFEAKYTPEERAADPTKAAHETMRKKYYDAGKRQYEALDDAGKKIYNDVRDHYVKQRLDTYNALQNRIEASGADAKTKASVMAQLRKTYESNRVEGPYFPLMRYGDRMGSAHDKDGNVVAFSRFEHKSEQSAWLKAMADKGFEVRAGQKMDDKSMMERIDPKFVQKVMEITKDADPKLAEEIWQTYLKAMPEMSMRKQFIHRIGRLGYTMDAMRNFSYNSFHGAHQLARLEFGHQLDTHIDNMKSEAQSVMDRFPGSKNADWAPALAKEMARRYEWIKNPRASPLASALTKFGFGWYLGAAPATAFRILSQNPMLAQPVLAGFHGQLGATRELSRASAQWAMSRGSLGDTLRGDERQAFDTARDRGVFSSTATQTLASGASDIPVTGTMATVMKAMGYLFNAAEHHNRMTTYLAAYRLGRQQGMDHGTAVNHATDATWDSHFDYTNANRPRILQNDVAKVIGLFKQYSWGVTYRLAREARNSIDGELTGEQRTQARKTLGGLLTRSAAFAGVTGLPLSWIATSVINAVMSDKDQPFDADAAGHEYLKQHLGQTAADAIMTGPMGALSGASLSGGASYSDLWYRPPSRDENAHDTVADALAQLGGALPAIPLNAASGLGMMADGQIERGFEHFVPPEVAAAMKAIRYAKEGATNLQGESIVDRDKLDNKDLFLQAIGFTPQKVADAYRQNQALKNVSKAILDRKRQIENKIAVAGGMGDEEAVKEAMDEVQHFNEKNPGIAIDARGLLSSVRNHFKNQAESINGVRLPPGLTSLRDTYGGNPEEPQQ